MTSIKLYGSKACGSAIAEAFLCLADIPYNRIELDYDKPSPLRDELRSKNPLGQVPTLILEDGFVLTETLAVAHYVNDLNSRIGLIPQKAKDRLHFFRWSTFLISSIYPCFTYGDSPEKWLGDSPDAPLLRKATTDQLKKLWRVVEEESGQPFFLGETFSAIDIYLKVMTHWRPGQEWMKENLPKVMAINKKVSAMPELKELWDYHFKDL